MDSHVKYFCFEFLGGKRRKCEPAVPIEASLSWTPTTLLSLAYERAFDSKLGVFIFQASQTICDYTIISHMTHTVV